MRNATWWAGYARPVLGMLAWFLAFLVLYGLAQGGVAAAEHFGVPGGVWLATIAAVAVFLAVYRVAVRRLDRREPSEVAAGGALRETAVGALIGAVAFAVAIGLLAGTGLYTLSQGSGLTTTGTAFAVAVLAGVCEEVLFRGIMFRRLAGPFGTYGALAGSALFFGGSHLANPGATLWSAVAIAVEAGVMLGLAYVVTARLWLPIGLHAAWNFVQGGVFGVAVSGNDVGGSLLRATPEAGRDALTGGAFGVEASPAAVLVCVVVGAVLLGVVRRRGLVEPPRWRRPVEAQTVSSTLPM